MENLLDALLKLITCMVYRVSGNETIVFRPCRNSQGSYGLKNLCQIIFKAESALSETLKTLRISGISRLYFFFNGRGYLFCSPWTSSGVAY